MFFLRRVAPLSFSSRTELAVQPPHEPEEAQQRAQRVDGSFEMAREREKEKERWWLRGEKTEGPTEEYAEEEGAEGLSTLLYQCHRYRALCLYDEMVKSSAAHCDPLDANTPPPALLSHAFILHLPPATLPPTFSAETGRSRRAGPMLDRAWEPGRAGGSVAEARA